MVDLRDLVQKALQSNAPMTALEAVVHDHPDLPEAIGKSWADGFGTDQIPPPIARFLVDRGAKLSVHAAAGFGFTDSLADLLHGDPMLVNAKGGDGCTPLHFARDVATAQFLLDQGADIDSRDEDHDSTPAQWRVGKAPEVKGVFIAFAVEDKFARDNLVYQAKRQNNVPFDFVDMSVKEPWDSKWKTDGRTRICGCDGVIAFISRNTATADGAVWEIKCAKEEGVPIKGFWVHADDPCCKPAVLGSTPVVYWTWDNISNFIDSL